VQTLSTQEYSLLSGAVASGRS